MSSWRITTLVITRSACLLTTDNKKELYFFQICITWNLRSLSARGDFKCYKTNNCSLNDGKWWPQVERFIYLAASEYKITKIFTEDILIFKNDDIKIVLRSSSTQRNTLHILLETGSRSGLLWLRLRYEHLPWRVSLLELQEGTSSHPPSERAVLLPALSRFGYKRTRGYSFWFRI